MSSTSFTDVTIDIKASNIHINVLILHNIDLYISDIKDMLLSYYNHEKSNTCSKLDSYILPYIFGVSIDEFISKYSIQPYSYDIKIQSIILYCQKLEKENGGLKQDIEEVRDLYISLKRHQNKSRDF